jgi:butyrate kinase
MEGYILVINPGSTSTKVALFKESTCIKAKNLTHSPNEVGRYERVAGQFEFRMEVILNWLNAEGVSLDDLAAVVGRGGILMPMPGGTYKVTQRMIDDLKAAVREEHASNLGAMLARGIADQKGIPSFIVDPVSVDEFDDIARISGLPELPRRSLIHALNIKAVSRRVVSRLGRGFEDHDFLLVVERLK